MASKEAIEKAGLIAARMQQIIHPDDTGTVGASILTAVKEHEPVSAEVFALAILRYRESTLRVSLVHMNYAHSLMRVMLDSLLAGEQEKSEKRMFNTSWMLAIVAIVVSAIALF